MSMTTNPYVAMPVRDWLRDRIDSSLSGQKCKAALDEIERLERENAALRKQYLEMAQERDRLRSSANDTEGKQT